MADDKPYRILTKSHVVKWDTQLQESIEGWEVKALWLATQTVIPVFVSDAHDLVQGVDQLVRAKGAELDALQALSA